MLVDSTAGMIEAIGAIIDDAELRHRLAEGALKHAAAFTWEASAHNAFAPLAQRAINRRRGGSTHP